MCVYVVQWVFSYPTWCGNWLLAHEPDERHQIHPSAVDLSTIFRLLFLPPLPRPAGASFGIENIQGVENVVSTSLETANRTWGEMIHRAVATVRARSRFLRRMPKTSIVRLQLCSTEPNACRQVQAAWYNILGVSPSAVTIVASKLSLSCRHTSNAHPEKTSMDCENNEHMRMGKCAPSSVSTSFIVWT